MKKNSEHKESGFTLIEVLIGIVILSVGVLAVTTLQIRTIDDNSRSWQRSEIANIATDKLEQLSFLPYSHPDLDLDADLDPPAVAHIPDQATDGIDNDHDGSIDNNAIAPENGSTFLMWNVTEGDIIENSKTITVTVSYVYHGDNRTMSYTQIKAMGI